MRASTHPKIHQSKVSTTTTTTTTMSAIDELYEKGKRHRDDLNELFQTTRATDERFSNVFRNFNSKIEANSNQISLQAAAKRRAIEAREALNRRIQDLEETVKEGKGLAASLDVHVQQTAMRFRSISGQVREQGQLLQSLQAIISTLTSSVQTLEAVPSRRCSNCEKVIQPVKASHTKCEDCYLSKKRRPCTICSSTYLPVHFSYKICPCCYHAKKDRKAKKQNL